MLKKNGFWQLSRRSKKRKKYLQLDNVIQAETMKRKDGNQKDLEDGVERQKRRGPKRYKM